VVILAVIPPGPTAANQTALNGMPSQPELPRPYWTGLSGRLAVTISPKQRRIRRRQATDLARWPTVRRESGAWQCLLQPETSLFVCRILARKLISISRQPVLIAASRCYLIQMLGSLLTCANGCSCWSPDEENSLRFFLTMDALYRLS
jgi:hypothetical protein